MWQMFIPNNGLILKRIIINKNYSVIKGEVAAAAADDAK